MQNIVIILLIIAIISLLLYMRLILIISYEDKLKIYIKFLGIKKALPNFEYKTKGKEKEKEKKKTVSISTGIDKFSDFINVYKTIFIKISRYLNKKITLEKFYLCLTFGTGDAAKTAIYTGGLWGFIYNLVGIMDTYIVVNKPEISITPVFNIEKFEIKFESIFSIRVVHIMVIGFSALFTYLSISIKEKLSKNKIKQKVV